MGQGMDILIAAVALICGVLLLTGHGDILLRGGDRQARKSMYDEEKMAKASGLVFVIIGIVTIIDSFLSGVGFKIAYTVIIAILFAGLVFYITKKCRK